MRKYRTLDQHVVYHGQVIEPDTEVEVHTEKDKAIWDELVDLKVAVRVAAKRKKATAEELAVLEETAEIAEPQEAAADEGQDTPAPPAKGRPKGKS